MSWLGIYENFFQRYLKIEIFRFWQGFNYSPTTQANKHKTVTNANQKLKTHLIYKMAAYTVEQINNAMTAPVEMVEGPRKSKVIAAARIAAPIAAAQAAKERKHRIAAE